MPMLRALLAAALLTPALSASADWIRDLQADAVETKSSPAAHWGPKPGQYSSWTTHSNRLIPVYTFGTLGAGEGIDLGSYTGAKSPYRDPAALRRMYRADQQLSVCDTADYMDQTNIFDLQLAAVEAGKKNVILVVFDGMDWQTTYAAATHNLQKVAYREGRGEGTHFQEYQADGTTQFGWMVTSPGRDGIQVNVSKQKVHNPSGGLAGGYDPRVAGYHPWSVCRQPEYLIAETADRAARHAYTDSASSATSMMCGVKTFNGAIGVTAEGRPAPSVAHIAQSHGYRVGVVTSVPISHATPASAYGHNVSRGDYQDLTRDLLGRPSVSHPDQPLAGMDVVIGGGHGVEVLEDGDQGDNFVPGNKYLTFQDMKAIDERNGGPYVVAQRTDGVLGGSGLAQAAHQAVEEGKRLFGYYGVASDYDKDSGHLPYASADGAYDPAPGVDGVEMSYSKEDLAENPTLAEMTSAALTVLSAGDKPFWVLVEAGDVDWANHSNNLDASIGAVNCGDQAVRVITDWVEKNSNWDETVLIVTADHGHYLVLDDPALLIPPAESE
ncbi:Alkaline phosphatase 4 precursor [Posidoniimonas corsicana]|uniref:Alkaline phosphatase 4 n=1 Tax=Posidoniimonas corsicana TaxID=1938618 RepID=A0A5C5VHH5_9BACT|nr:alkaline phosphatase [Posidoniimonas corsicana]TWT37400.1 Alkaline phosphatase 4 precursor [Posidoniimonas corsicana]